MKPVVKIGRIEVKPRISPSSELVFSLGQYQKMDGERKDEADAECLLRRFVL